MCFCTCIWKGGCMFTFRLCIHLSCVWAHQYGPVICMSKGTKQAHGWASSGIKQRRGGGKSVDFSPIWDDYWQPLTASKQTCTHAHTLTHITMHSDMHWHIHTFSHACTNTLAQKHIYVQAHTRTRTHTEESLTSPSLHLPYQLIRVLMTRSPLHRVMRNTEAGGRGYHRLLQTESQKSPADKISASTSKTPQDPFLPLLFFRWWHTRIKRALIKGRFLGELRQTTCIIRPVRYTAGLLFSISSWAWGQCDCPLLVHEVCSLVKVCGPT